MLRRMFGAWVCLGLFGGAMMLPAQDPPLPGGFGKASVKDEEVVKAAKFAVNEQSKLDKNGPFKLEKIVSAKQQVVAGMNYDLELKVQSKGKTRDVLVRVWKKLDGTHELSKWEIKKGTGESKPDAPK